MAIVEDVGVAEINIGSAPGSTSAVSWGAIIAGAVVAAAVSLILLVLGSGLGLAVVSPWSNSGVTLATLATSTLVWLVVVQWVASAVGGYLTGRLRTRWTAIHTDEVFFRDTAHGFVTWALATAVAAALFGSAVSSVIGGSVQTVATVASGAAQGATQAATGAAAGGLADPSAYFVDSLFRASRVPAPADATAPAAPPASGDSQTYRAEAGRILVNGIAGAEFPGADRTYLAQIVAEHTGLSADDAQKRVDEVIAQMQAAKAKAKEAADQARKAGVTLSLATFLALLIGAFIASAAAAVGGHLRDNDTTLVRR